MKKTLLLLCVFCLCFSLVACKGTQNGEITMKSVAGNYIWEKEGFGGPFNIYLKKDGSCTYYVGYNSDHLGKGSWSLDDGIVKIVETKESSGLENIFYFRADGNSLVFIKESSDQFMYLALNDGEKFLRSKVDTK